MIRVEVSSDAEADLDSIYVYSLENFGEAVADAYFLDLRGALGLLSDYPEIGMVRADLRNSPRCLPCREHHIFYRFDGARVMVSRVLSKRMDPSVWLT